MSQVATNRPSLPPSGLDRCDELLDELRVALDGLLKVSHVEFYDPSSHSGLLVVGWNKWQWGQLPDEAAPKVGRAREAFARLTDFISTLARTAPDRARELEGIDAFFERVIEQPNGSYPNGAPESTIEKVGALVEKELTEYGEVIRRLPAAHGTAQQLLVAGTSALLDRPDLGSWKLDGKAWTIILLPQVLSELDERKRDARTRDAAQKVINQIEDFDRRGDTFIGVPLSGKLSIREVPFSPDMSKTLPWLRPDVPDDAIIAGALELVAQDLTARVALTASDRNIRNKARLAGLGVVHPNEL